MSRHPSARAALSRAFVVVAATSSALLVTAAGAMAEPVTAADPSVGATVSAGPAVAGVALGTFMWALVGVVVLVVGFVAAARSGRHESGSLRPALGRPGIVPAAAIRSFQPAAAEAPGEPTPVAVTI